MESGENLSSTEETFLGEISDIVDSNLCNEHFGAKELAQKIGISRSQLHRRMRRLNGKSTTQFIREYRLEKAYEMLKAEVGTAADISYRVGFGSPTYFNRCFHEYFGYAPGNVKRKNSIIRELNKLNNQHIELNLKDIKNTPYDSLINEEDGMARERRVHISVTRLILALIAIALALIIFHLIIWPGL